MSTLSGKNIKELIKFSLLLFTALFSISVVYSQTSSILIHTNIPDCRNTNSQENCIIAYFKDFTVTDKNNSHTYRVLLSRDNQQRYIVQDFYSQTHHAYTEPFVIRDPQDLNKTLDDYTMVNISIDGRYIGWYPDGQKEFEFLYANGVPVGIWFGWHENGNILFKEVKSGDLTGTELWWYKDGLPRSEKRYQRDKELAIEVWWYENGQKESEGSYINDHSRQGWWKYWYKNGQLKEESLYDQGKLQGTSKKWDENGNPIP
ncbi:toxin-antitoxin system YwqK family antitoxin [Budviciaceae bacterium BWR-B9]|uniref:Toxin-antitoxin system YwqK family antitoxin n=1 Tax=Limnobaculum allomyrinae TaxID=2791986 RepID=A0ABS1IS44_9GAMM|nr:MULTISPECIES: toxin-antitoxin system YwqK family antitoxin [Limnobaculum]MBK5144376.1 toxin-antitoxin system YwqK family antitoxin [Limnobaculum allomyrinae]MBV7691879.1 toxin-antitoxin system YwqK family antitoxin [Limnobaculum sp. M2-1]